MLRKNFDGYDNLPATAKYAMLDMAFNMGGDRFNSKKWSNFAKALKDNNYSEMARQSVSNDPGSERVVERVVLILFADKHLSDDKITKMTKRIMSEQYKKDPKKHKQDFRANIAGQIKMNLEFTKKLIGKGQIKGKGQIDKSKAKNIE